MKKAKIHSVLNLVLLIPFLLVIATVFIVGRDLSNGIVSGKYFWFYGGMGVVTLFVFIKMIFSNTGFRFTLTDMCVLLFVGSIFVSSLLVNDASQNTTKLTILVLLTVLYFSVSFLTGGYKFKGFNQNLICIFMIITGLIEAVWGLRQLYGFESSQHSLFKVTGSFFNPGPYSGYLAVIFPLAIYNWLYPLRFKEKKTSVYYLSVTVKWLSCITGVIIFLILPAAMSRSAWLAAAGGSLVVLGAYVKDHFPVKEYYMRHKRKIGLVTLTSFLLLFVALTGMYRMKKDSADGRTLMWKVALYAVTKHPLGVGVGNFSEAYGNAQAEYLLSGKASEKEEYVAGNPEYAFNEYLQILIESGIQSFVFFIFLVILAIYSLYKKRKWGILGALVSLLIFACFSYPFSVLPYLILFTFFLALSNNRKSVKEKKSWGILLSFTLLFISFICLYKQYPVYKAYKKWDIERIYYNAGLYKEGTDSYAELYPFLKDNIKFLFEYAQSLSKSQQYIQSNEVLSRATQISCDPMLYNIKGKNYQALKKYEEAENHFIRSSQIVPNRIYPYFLLAKLYYEMNLTDKACEMVKIVQTKDPKVDSRAVEEMREELKIMNCINDK